MPIRTKGSTWIFCPQHAAYKSRLLHQTAIRYARKPKSAVFKPPTPTDSNPKSPLWPPLKGTQPPPRKASLAGSQDRGPSPSVARGSPLTSKDTTTDPSAAARTDSTESIDGRARTVVRPTSSVGLPRSTAQVNYRTPVGLVNYTNKSLSEALAAKSQATVLYQSGSLTQFTLVSYSSAVFMFWAGYMNAFTYTLVDSIYIKLAGQLSSGVFVAVGMYFALAPQRMIKSITAVPQPKSSLVHHRPLLRVEFARILPWIGLKPLDLPVTAVQRMHLVATKINYLQEEKAMASRRSNVGDGFFNRVRLLLQDLKKMFDRRHYMGYLRLKGDNGLARGTFKMDLSEAIVLDQGKALDTLLAKEPNPPAWRVITGTTDSSST